MSPLRRLFACVLQTFEVGKGVLTYDVFVDVLDFRLVNRHVSLGQNDVLLTILGALVDLKWWA